MNTPVRNFKRGQSLVEFAIILPLFILIVMMIFDLGRAVYYYSAIYNAAREGARYGVVNPADTAGMEQTARNYLFGIDLNPGTLQVSSQHFPKPDYKVQVTVAYAFTPITPLVSRFLPGGNITLRSRSLMETED
jgi:Flp pilus assembly protein TadG